MSSDDRIARALAGEEISVDFRIIERSLAELWKQDDSDHGVTKAALWNVVAHATEEEKDGAGDVLSTVSMSVPQRSILVSAEHEREDQIRAWISANCFLVGGGQKVCSESITIVAGGSRVAQVPPIVNALLIPDLPVAAWWLGDLPAERAEYLEAVLDPADRLIVDSSQFDDVSDLQFVAHLAEQTSTRPADLNWSRIEEWRAATASMFDIVDVRQHAQDIVCLTVHHSAAGHRFGDVAQARLYASWLLGRLQYSLSDGRTFISPSGVKTEVRFVPDHDGGAGTLGRVEVEFRDDVRIDLRRADDNSVRAEASGLVHTPATVTQIGSRDTAQLIVRELSRAATDCVFIDLLPAATRFQHE